MIETDITPEGGSGGRTYLILVSGHLGAKEATYSEIAMLRCSYDSKDFNLKSLAVNGNDNGGTPINQSLLSATLTDIGTIAFKVSSTIARFKITVISTM